MSRISGEMLREPVTGEAAERVPDLTVRGFTLRNVSIKRTKETGAPVHLFDVLDGNGERIGIASFVDDDHSSKAVQHFGHVCVTLSEAHSAGPLLADLGKAVMRVAHEKGHNAVRVVVPPDHPPSVHACELLKSGGEVEPFKVGDQGYLAYHYPLPMK